VLGSVQGRKVTGRNHEGRKLTGRTCVFRRGKRGRAREAEQGYKARGESRILAAGLGERGVGGVGHGDDGEVLRAQGYDETLRPEKAFYRPAVCGID